MSRRETVTVRRAVLPWRRRVRPSRFDFAPRGGLGELVHEPLGFWLALLSLPLWLPALIMTVPALVELAVEVVVLPFALAVRSSRGSWPVQVLRGSTVVRSESSGTFAEAGRLAQRWRDEALLAGVA